MPGALLGNGNNAVNTMLNVAVLIKLTLLKAKSGNFFLKEFIRLR